MIFGANREYKFKPPLGDLSQAGNSEHVVYYFVPLIDMVGSDDPPGVFRCFTGFRCSPE